MKKMDDQERIRQRMMEREQYREGRVTEQNRIKNVWLASYRGWIYSHYALGIFGMLLSTIIASKPKWFHFSEDFYGLLAWLLAFSTAVFTFLNASERGNRYRRAWLLLSSALTLYRARICE